MYSTYIPLYVIDGYVFPAMALSGLFYPRFRHCYALFDFCSAWMAYTKLETGAITNSSELGGQDLVLHRPSPTSDAMATGPFICSDKNKRMDCYYIMTYCTVVYRLTVRRFQSSATIFLSLREIPSSGARHPRASSPLMMKGAIKNPTQNTQ